jgi:hypothetical protein
LLLWFLFLGFAFGLWRWLFFILVAVGDVVRHEVTIAVTSTNLDIGGDGFFFH